MSTAKPKPDSTPPSEPVAYRATTDIYIPGVGSVPANGVIEVDPNHPAVAVMISHQLLVK